MSAPQAAAPAAQPLLDLHRLMLSIRRRRRMWLSTALLGLLAGGLLATFMPPPPTAVARLLIIHEEDQPSSAGTLMRTDIALLQTARIAGEALKSLNSTEPPEELLRSFHGTGLTNNVLELTVSGTSEADAVAKAKAVAEAFVADHVRRLQAAAAADAQALLTQRDKAQEELAAADASIAETTVRNSREAPAQLESLYATRAELASKISDLSRRAEEAAIGRPRVAAGTQIVDAPRAVKASPARAAVTSGGIGMVLGLVLGLALAAVTSIVRDRPVLRQEISEQLAASVVAQLATPRRGPAVLWRRRAAARRKRVAATLARALGEDPAPVSLLDLGAGRTTIALAADLAQRMAEGGPVMIVNDLPGRDRGRLASVTVPAAHAVRVVDGSEPDQVQPGERQLGVGSVAPGAAWTDLRRLGTETVLVARAGHAGTTWLHTVARQLADLRVPVIGVVLVDPDPRDRSDGTLWDPMYTALRGRTGRRLTHEPPPGQRRPPNGEPAPREPDRPQPAYPQAAGSGGNGSGRHAEDYPTERFARIRPAVLGATNGTHAAAELPAERFDPVWPTAEDVEVLANVRLFGQRRIDG